MPDVTVTLVMPSVDFDHFEGVEIWFKEDGVMKKLDPAEWSAYFPGCEYPVAMRPRERGVEAVWSGIFPESGREAARMINYVNFLYGFDIGTSMPSIRGRVAESILSPLETICDALGAPAAPAGSWELLQVIESLLRACTRWPQARVVVGNAYQSTPVGDNGTPLHGSPERERPVNREERFLNMPASELGAAMDRGEITPDQYLEYCARRTRSRT